MSFRVSGYGLMHFNAPTPDWLDHAENRALLRRLDWTAIADVTDEEFDALS